MSMTVNQYPVGQAKPESEGDTQPVNHAPPDVGNTLLNQVSSSVSRNTERLDKLQELLSEMREHHSPGYVEKREKRKAEKVNVEVKVTYMKIVDIVTENQNFEAEVFIQAKWEDPEINPNHPLPEHASFQEKESRVTWDPRLILVNVDGLLHVNKKSYDIKFNEPGYRFPVVYQLWRVKGFFKENLELQHFPLDIQDLTISISSDRPLHEVSLTGDQKAQSSVNPHALMNSQQWALYKHVETFCTVTTVEHGSAHVHPLFIAQCRVARKVAYFVWNIVFIMLLVVCLTVTGHQLAFDNSDRLVITVILFLTGVTFKLVVKSTLPTLSYLTYLDVWVLGCLVFLVLQAAQNAYLNNICRYMTIEDVTFIDKWSMVGLTLLFFVGNLVYVIYVHKRTSARRYLMEDNDRIYKLIKRHVDRYGKLPNKLDQSSTNLVH